MCVCVGWGVASSTETGSICIQVQLKVLAEEMQAISKGLEKVVQELSTSENDGPISSNFRMVLKHTDLIYIFSIIVQLIFNNWKLSSSLILGI